MATSEHVQVDYIRKVALVGGAGQIGSHFLKHLLLTGKHTVTVLTRTDGAATFPSYENLVVARVDYASENSLVEALRGNDFLIITLAARNVAPTLHADIIAAAAKAGVHCVMPNYYGYGTWLRGGNANVFADPILDSFKKWIDDLDAYEQLHWVALVCGFWYEFSVGMGEAWLGFDIKARKVTFFDDGKRRISTSTWEQCGRAVAALLSLPVQKQPDGALSAQDWDKTGVFISSFLVSQRDILDSLHRVLGTSDKDWTIAYQKVEDRYKEGKEELAKGNMIGFAKMLYSRIFFPNGEGDYETGHVLDNGKLGLPKENLDEATKRAVEMVEAGFGYLG